MSAGDERIDAIRLHANVVDILRAWAPDEDEDSITDAILQEAFGPLLERLEQVERSEARLADAVALLLTDYGGPTSIGHMQRATRAGHEALQLRGRSDRVT